MTDEETAIDLFGCPEQQPADLKAAIDRYSEQFESGQDPAEVCREFLAVVEELGFTFEYGLDWHPYDLRPTEVGQRLQIKN